MRTSRILPLLGPALALYLVADAAADARGLDGLTWLLASLAIAFTLTPFVVRGLARDEIPGARSVGLLGGLTGVALASSLVPAALSGLRELTLALLLPLIAFVLVDLAWRVPDTLALRRRLRPALLLATGSIFVLGVVASMPPLSLGSELVLVPSLFARLPLWSVLVAIVVALTLRLSRRRLGSSPEALAANAWAVLGLLPALVAGVIVALAGRGLAPMAWAPALLAGGATTAVFGHVALVDPRRRLRAGRAVRRSVVSALGVLAVGALAFVAHDALPREPIPFVTALVLGWAAISGLLYLAERAVHRLLAPYGGRLLDAVSAIREALPRCAHLDDLAAAVLRPLREATGSVDAQPLLLGLDPGREASLDAAGNARVRARPFPEELRFLADLGVEGGGVSAELQSALESSGRLIVSRSIDAQVVRRAELRPLGELLHVLDALCVVPLVREGELEGAIVIPRGRRGAALALEEIHALDTLAHEVTGLLSIFAARERARGRVGEISRDRDRLSDALDATREALDRAERDAHALRAGRGAARRASAAVAYSEAMQALEARVEEVAAVDAPLTLLAEGGSDVDRVAHRIHARGPRAEGPFVVADCAAMTPEDAEVALFGDDERPGWLRLAAGGTLLLADIPALPTPTQHALAEALAQRQGRAVGGAPYPLDVRLLVTSRVPLAPLAAAETFLMAPSPDGALAGPRAPSAQKAQSMAPSPDGALAGPRAPSAQKASLMAPSPDGALAGPQAPLAQEAFDPELMRWLTRLEVQVPPLRQRRDDLPSLVLLALDRACRVFGRGPLGIEQAALDALIAHDWPGNLRELQHVIDRAVARAAGPKIRRADLPALAGAAARLPADPLDGTYEDVERRVCERALALAQGNKSEAARALGLKRSTFLDKLRRLGLDTSERKPSAQV